MAAKGGSISVTKEAAGFLGMAVDSSEGGRMMKEKRKQQQQQLPCTGRQEEDLGGRRGKSNAALSRPLYSRDHWYY